MNRRAADIAIAGGGIVGAALALVLAQAGRRVALIEASQQRSWSPQLPPDLRVYALSPANSELLAKVGAWTAVTQARCKPYVRMEVWDAGGGDPLRFNAADGGAPVLGHIAEDALLQHALWTRIEAEPAIQVYRPATVTALVNGTEKIELGLDDGRRVPARLAVAADGGDSTLREMAGIGVRRVDYGQLAIVAFVETEQEHGDTAWQRFLPTGPLAFLPFAARCCSIVWSLPTVEAERLLEADDSVFCGELGRAFDFRLGRILGVSKRRAFPLRRQLAERYVIDRVVLAGDAAHVVHPLAGQGVNLGLADVSALCEALATGPLEGMALARRLRVYERARRSENTIAAYSFETLNRGFSNSALLPTLLRGHALAMVNRIAPLKQWFARQAVGNKIRSTQGIR